MDEASSSALPSHAECMEIPICGRLESSRVPPAVLRGEAVKLGIDEAGRGPVLGAMTFGTCYWAIGEDGAIEADQKEIDDSKQLTEEKRFALFERIASDARMGWGVEVVSARRLSAEMLQTSPTSLNAISFEATCRLIQRALDRGANVVEAFVDTVGDPDAYAAKLDRAFESRIKFTVAKKADALYKCTGAASICAKVCRDLSLSRWAFDEPGLDDRDFGSGYPSDDVCKRWLRRNVHAVFGFPSLTRFSWQTTKTALGESLAAGDADPETKAAYAKIAKVQWDDKDDDDAAANSMKITDWATVTKKKQAAPPRKKRKRAHFYRTLESLTAF